MPHLKMLNVFPLSLVHTLIPPGILTVKLSTYSEASAACTQNRRLESCVLYSLHSLLASQREEMWRKTLEGEFQLKVRR